MYNVETSMSEDMIIVKQKISKIGNSLVIVM